MLGDLEVGRAESSTAKLTTTNFATFTLNMVHMKFPLQEADSGCPWAETFAAEVWRDVCTNEVLWGVLLWASLDLMWNMMQALFQYRAALTQNLLTQG